MSDEFPVVAFLQNCWFRPGTPDAIIRQYLTDQSYRRKVLAKSMSGRRLLTAFGEDAYRRIWWDNASEHVATHAAGSAEADIAHMRRIVNSIAPKAIITLGLVATDGLSKIWPRSPGTQMCERYMNGMEWHAFPHPNARGLTQFQLNEFARQIISRYL